MKTFTHRTTRNTPASKTYTQPVYQDHPAVAVPLTGEFTITSDEALYILTAAAQARALHFDWIKLLDRRIVWLDYEPNAIGGFTERRTPTVYQDSGIMVSGDNFHIQGRRVNDGPLLKTMHIRLDDLVHDFALEKRQDEPVRRAA